mgnify:CR=1 FL=1
MERVLRIDQSVADGVDVIIMAAAVALMLTMIFALAEVMAPCVSAEFSATSKVYVRSVSSTSVALSTTSTDSPERSRDPRSVGYDAEAPETFRAGVSTSAGEFT